MLAGWPVVRFLFPMYGSGFLLGRGRQTRLERPCFGLVSLQTDFGSSPAAHACGGSPLVEPSGSGSDGSSPSLGILADSGTATLFQLHRCAPWFLRDGDRHGHGTKGLEIYRLEFL